MSQHDPSTCDVEGNVDLYGLGIRVGFYAQWTSTLIVRLFVQDEIPTYRTINLLLQLAVLVCLVFTSARGTINAPEGMIAFWLLVGSPSSFQWGLVKRTGTVSRLFRFALYAALSAYGCWFWFSGMDGLPQMPCTAYAFFGGTTMDGWFRWVGKVASVCGLAVSVGILVRIGVHHWRHGDYEQAATHEEKSARSEEQERPQMDVGLLAVSVLVMTLSIVGIEFLIIDNQLVGVDDILEPGQLIPLIVGIFGLLGAFSSLFEGNLTRPQCLTLMGHHFT